MLCVVLSMHAFVDKHLIVFAMCNGEMRVCARRVHPRTSVCVCVCTFYLCVCVWYMCVCLCARACVFVMGAQETRKQMLSYSTGLDRVLAFSPIMIYLSQISQLL